MSDERNAGPRPSYREVPADLVENDPDNGALFHWLLACPMLLFIAWVWIDIFAHFSPNEIYWVDAIIAIVLYIFLGVLPLGIAAFFAVSAFPRLFGHAGWDVQPLESVAEAELHTVRYRYQGRHRAPNSWGRAWVRAAQGWVYLEIVAIFAGALAMVPIFMSVSDFGFGR